MGREAPLISFHELVLIALKGRGSFSIIFAFFTKLFPPFHLVTSAIAHYLYKTEEDCIDRLKQFAEAPIRIPMPLDVPFSQIDWTYCRDDYKKLLSPQDGTVAMPMANHVDHLKVADDD